MSCVLISKNILFQEKGGMENVSFCAILKSMLYRKEGEDKGDKSEKSK